MTYFLIGVAIGIVLTMAYYERARIQPLIDRLRGKK